MNTLNCKVCKTLTICNEDATAVTCSDCVNKSIDVPITLNVGADPASELGI